MWEDIRLSQFPGILPVFGKAMEMSETVPHHYNSEAIKFIRRVYEMFSTSPLK